MAPEETQLAQEPTRADELRDPMPTQPALVEQKQMRQVPAAANVGASAGGPDADTAFWVTAIVESSVFAIFTKGLDGTIRTWNRGAERLYGYSPDEEVGRSVQMFVPEDRAEEWSHVMSRLARGEHIEQLETERIRKDGQRVRWR